MPPIASMFATLNFQTDPQSIPNMLRGIRRSINASTSAFERLGFSLGTLEGQVISLEVQFNNLEREISRLPSDVDVKLNVDYGDLMIYIQQIQTFFATTPFPLALTVDGSHLQDVLDQLELVLKIDDIQTPDPTRKAFALKIKNMLQTSSEFAHEFHVRGITVTTDGKKKFNDVLAGLGIYDDGQSGVAKKDLRIGVDPFYLKRVIQNALDMFWYTLKHIRISPFDMHITLQNALNRMNDVQLKKFGILAPVALDLRRQVTDAINNIPISIENFRVTATGFDSLRNQIKRGVYDLEKWNVKLLGPRIQKYLDGYKFDLSFSGNIKDLPAVINIPVAQAPFPGGGGGQTSPTTQQVAQRAPGAPPASGSGNKYITNYNTFTITVPQGGEMRAFQNIIDIFQQMEDVE